MSLSSLLSGNQASAVLDSIVTNISISVMVTQASDNTPIVYVNGAFTELTGYDPSDVLNRSPALLQGPKTDQTVIDRLRQDLSAGLIFEGETINYRKDGAEFLMSWRVFPINDVKGNPLYFVALQHQG